MKNNYARWLPAFIFLLLFSLLELKEWWAVGVIADPNVIKNYPWGEAGGVYSYRNPSTYAMMSLIRGVAEICMAVLFVVLGKSQLGALYVALYGLSAIVVFSGYFF